MHDYLKITRKRCVFEYFAKIESLSMRQGYSCVRFDSLRWNRLQLCIDSIESHLSKELSLRGLYV